MTRPHDLQRVRTGRCPIRGVSPLALVAALASGAIPAGAQVRDDIIVTGRGLGERTRGPTDATVTLPRERLTETASGRLEDALADVAGLQSFRRADSRSANPTSQGITLRGIGGNASSRALLILDGVPQADPFGGWIAFPAYASGRLGQVQVGRGGGSAIWGSGALAGVVEMTSATPDQLPRLAADIAYGNRGAVDAQGSATLARDGGFATVTAQYARGDGFAPIRPEDRGAVDRAAPFEQASIAIRSVVRIAPATELQAMVQTFTDRRDRGLAFTAIESDGADASLRLVGRGRWQWSALGYVQTRRFASQFASVSADRSTVAPTLDQFNVPGTGTGARVELTPPIGHGITLRLGADTRTTGGETQELYTFVAGEPTRRRVAGGTTRTIGAFADATLDLGGVELAANGRIDRWQIVDGRLVERALVGGDAITDARFADRSGTEATGRLGIAWSPDDRVTLRSAAYRGWRLPTPNELYRPFRAGADATAANALLAPERLDGIEAGIDIAVGGRLRVGTTLFANRLSDAVANVTVARGPGNFPGVGFVSAAGFYRRRDNLDAIDARGVELDARLTLGQVVAQASYALADARVRASGTAAALDGLRPAQVPRHQASSTLAWSHRGYRLSGTLRYVAEQFEDDQNSRVLGDAATFDLTAAIPLVQGVAFDARVENLFDAAVATGFSGDAREIARPRQFWIGLRAELDRR